MNVAMLGLIFAIIASPRQAPIEQPPRLRTALPNGTLVLVERVPGARTLALGLYAGSLTCPDTPKTHGYRHLIEHLLAQGKSGDLDQRLETAGAFLRPRTVRDAICFEFSLANKDLKLGVEAIQEILSTRIPPPDRIRKEVEILKEEAALRDATAIASQTAWHRAYGDGGLDPFGDLTTLESATSESLEPVRAATFDSANLVVTVVGDVDLDATTALVANAVKDVPHTKAAPAPVRKLNPTEDSTSIRGNFRGVPTKGFRDPATAATLAACLAAASEVPKAQVIYTPSGLPGLVMVGTSEPLSDFDSLLSKLSAEELFDRGRDLALRWVRLRLGEVGGVASFRGLLLVGGSDLKPEIMVENLQSMKYSAFAAALRRLQSAEAIAVGEGK